jgi:hypothetical protein
MKQSVRLITTAVLGVVAWSVCRYLGIASHWQLERLGAIYRSRLEHWWR